MIGGARVTHIEGNSYGLQIHHSLQAEWHHIGEFYQIFFGNGYYFGAVSLTTDWRLYPSSLIALSRKRILIWLMGLLCGNAWP